MARVQAVDLKREATLNGVRLNPALLTYEEYRAHANPSGKWHPSSAYDMTVAAMNSFGQGKADYPIRLRTRTINGLRFEFRLDKRDRWEARYCQDGPSGDVLRDERGNVVYMSREEVERTIRPRWEYRVGVFDEDGQRVAFTDDEWGCVLIAVAREYRGFGLGPIIGQMARTLDPGKTSGGFTPGGADNFRKLHREMVRDALRDGAYRRLVAAGELTAARVRDILASAHLSERPADPTRINLGSDNPDDWLLYVGEHGDFILYDKKLRALYEDGERFAHFDERMIKGMVYAHAGQDGYCRIKVFGGDDDRIRRFMMNLALNYARSEGTTLVVEPADLPHVDRERAVVRSEEPGVKPGYWSHEVDQVAEVIDPRLLGLPERRFRAAFDRYDEFFHRMMELAYAKYQTPAEPEAERRLGR